MNEVSTSALEQGGQILYARDPATRKRSRMPYSIKKTDGAYQVVDRETGKVYSRHTSKENAERQRRLLEGVRHGWRPTGKKPDGR
jgi:hypothetical protein